MTFDDLLALLASEDIRLGKSDGDLDVYTDKDELDPALVGGLRAHKAALLELIGDEEDALWEPPAIRPEMLPLVELSQAEIDRIVAGVPGGASNVQDIYPLAPLQEGILFHHLLAEQGDPYLLPALVSFASRDRLDAYLAAVQAVIDRHDILRTAMAWEGLPEPVQVVWRRAALEVEEVALGEGDAVAQLRAHVDPRHHRMDVRRAPLVRGYVARDEEGGRWLLLLLLHHLVSDHTTMEVVLGEVQAHLLGRAHALPAALPFRNLVAQARFGVSPAEHEAFFTALLGDVDGPTAPFGLLDVRGDGSGVREGRLEVDAAVVARLRERARMLGVSAASLCHVAWAQVVAHASGRDDVVFGTVLFGRMQGGAGADRVVGPFINTLPVRLGMGEGAAASVRRMQTLLAGLLRHEHASLALAQRCSGVRAPDPLFSSLLNYRHGGRAGRSAAAWEGIEGLHVEERSNYPLTLSVDDVGDGLAVTAKVRGRVEPMRVCSLMHAALEGLVDALASAPGMRLRDIPLLAPAERARVVEEWNATAVAYTGECVHELIEAQVERTPGAVAVVYEGGSLTYAE
ncbi:MAG: Polyketide synthase modules and related proteins, partial [uncultured Gemmatimonadetes bacterium]